MKPTPVRSLALLKRAVVAFLVGFGSIVILAVVALLLLIGDPVRSELPAHLGSLILAAGIALLLGSSVSAAWALRRIDALHDDATADPLTGLLNRTEVRNRLAQLLEDSPNKHVAAIAVDFDDFKTINKVWGHLVGDHALVELTERLAQGIGDRGFAGRLGGVEFLVAWTVQDSANALGEVQRLVDSVSTPSISIEGAALTLTVSCGFSVRRPGEDTDMVTLLRNADLALATAKAQSRTVVQFDRAMALSSRRDHERELALVAAVEREEFEIHFQPEVDVRNGKTIGAEALLRWRTADGGLLPAKDFIDDLERFHVIDRLTPLLLAEAERLADLIGDADFTVRLNFGARQLCDQSTLNAIAAAQARSATGWCLEITERTIVESDAAVLASLEALVAEGVTLALDDFGTGYSSLAELGNLPISTVKIDRSFVDTLTVGNASTSLVSVVREMADRLALDVIAEGIETEEQRQALDMIGCRYGQGWLFGHAVPIEDFTANLASRQHQSV